MLFVVSSRRKKMHCNAATIYNLRELIIKYHLTNIINLYLDLPLKLNKIYMISSFACSC